MWLVTDSFRGGAGNRRRERVGKATGRPRGPRIKIKSCPGTNNHHHQPATPVTRRDLLTFRVTAFWQLYLDLFFPLLFFSFRFQFCLYSQCEPDRRFLCEKSRSVTPSLSCELLRRAAGDRVAWPRNGGLKGCDGHPPGWAEYFIYIRLATERHQGFGALAKCLPPSGRSCTH